MTATVTQLRRPPGRVPAEFGTTATCRLCGRHRRWSTGRPDLADAETHLAEAALDAHPCSREAKR